MFLRKVLLNGFAVTALLADTCSVVAQQNGPDKNAGQSKIAHVLELYTSQGCSSCPAADHLFSKYSGRSDVLALSFNVDIWDKLGWKDTLAKPQYTERQRAYARTRGDGQVYTPQAVVDGVSHAVGSDQGVIDLLLKSDGLAVQPQSVELAVRSTSEGVVVEASAFPSSRGASEATLWLAKVVPRTDVRIMRGENAGKTITYYNTVRDFRFVSTWSGGAMTARLLGDAIGDCEPGTCAVMLQQGGSGRILGAAWVRASAR